MAAPIDALSAAQRKRHVAALDALGLAGPQAIAERALADWASTAGSPGDNPGRGVRSRPARTLCTLPSEAIRYLAIDAYLRGAGVATVVAGLRQQVALDHGKARCRWIALEGSRGRLADPKRVYILDGNAPGPPNIGAILKALSAGDRTLVEALLPSDLPRATKKPPIYRCGANLVLALLHPHAHPRGAAIDDAQSCLNTKLGAFDRAVIEALFAIVDDRAGDFADAFREAIHTQANASWVHTPFGPSATIGKWVATPAFGLAVLAAWAHGRTWLDAVVQPVPVLFPEGTLDALLDPAPTAPFVVFDGEVGFLAEPAHVATIELAAWRGTVGL